ncbi:inositol-trisphosphate 3-kinase A-like [Carassius carassius]|uniref:inositol-trisphosphate 3-kinase A-like n=1 Tax=Carassius carassius TaxID=217509 RepID=UPI002868D65C|nr:inositol-trisphosphate 3-kinase A-like [Carassius carassius]
MPKQRRRSLREAVFFHSSPVGDGSRRGGGGGGGGRAGNFSSIEICDDQAQMAEQFSGQAGFLSDGNRGRVCLVPQVTITSDGDSREITEEDLEEEVNGRLRRKLSNSSISSNGSSTAFDESEDDILSDNETKSKGIVTLEHLGDSVDSGEQSNAWWKLKTIVSCPLVNSQRRRLSWVQLAGHKGSFKAGDEGSILKKFSENEKLCFERLKEDALHSFVPSYYGVVERDGELFLKMRDLLAKFDLPNVMDCKMGVRTYLEEELARARVKPKLREDLYNKMLEVDGEAPTAEEKKQKAVTKPRYMQWRESLSSTNTLGFRIEGIKRGETCNTDFKKTRSKEDVIQVFKDFVKGNKNITNSYITRLEDIKQALKASEFFKKHEVIGSSLLFIHDHTERAEVWLIDFGKTTPLLDGQNLDHYRPWEEGNREDGYLWGLENLLQTLSSLARE